MSFYITTPIYYVNAQPHLGHAYTTIACRRARAPHAPARRGRVLPDRHRRARRAGRGCGARAGARAQGARRHERGAVQGADAAAERVERLLHPHIRSAAHGSRSRRCCRRSTTTGYTYKGMYEGWYCPRCADFKVENEILDGNRCPIHEIELDARAARRTGSSACRLPGAARAAVRRRAARLRDAPPPLPRGAFVHRPGAPGRVADPRASDLGDHRPVGPEPRLLRLVRRPSQLLHGARRTRGPARI